MTDKIPKMIATDGTLSVSIHLEPDARPSCQVAFSLGWRRIQIIPSVIDELDRPR
jgi:hypothetical protein